MHCRPRWAAVIVAVGVWFAAQPATAQPSEPPQAVPAPPVDPDQDVEPRPYDPGASPSSPGPGNTDEYGDATEPLSDAGSPRVRYLLERVVVRGNKRTKSKVIRDFIPVKDGELLDPEDREIEAIQWRLMGTGWFDQVVLRLERGSQRGWVELVVEVVERNTVVIGRLAVGLAEGLADNLDTRGDLRPYFGATVTETNLAGVGISLSGSVLFAQRSQGFRVDLVDPLRLGGKFSLRVSGFFNNALEFFGNEPLVSFPCVNLPACPNPVAPVNAVLPYRRGGLLLGTGRGVGTFTHYTIDWQGDFVNVRELPDAASEIRGNDVRAIDFGIIEGRSFVSSLRFGLTYDKRDDPGMTTRGILVRGMMTAGTRLLGSDYDFLKIQGVLHKWFHLPRRHTIRLGAFAGVVLGDAPFFYLFHLSDLTDLIPSRILEIQLDRRPPPNLLNTSIAVMRQEELAARLDLTYELPVYRRPGSRGLRALNAYFLIGVYGLADLRDPKVGISGYTGASRIPIDLTFDFGFRFDTRVGVIQVGFSNLLGFIQW